MRLPLCSRRTLAAFATGVAALALSACGSGADDGAVTIGFVNGDSSEYATCLQKAVTRTAKTENARLYTSNSQMDPGKEISNIEDMLSRGVDALVVQTVNVDALKGDIAKAKAAKVPIYLTSVATSNVSDILGATVVDLKKLGALDAGWVAKDAGSRPVKVGIVAGSPGAASDLMVSGFTGALPPTATVVANQPGMFNAAKAHDVAENMIQAHPDLDYVFVANEDMAFAARKAFDEAGAKKVKIVTENGTEPGLAAVQDGRFSATVANSPDLIGQTTVKNVVRLLDGGSDNKITQIPLTLVTKDHLGDAPKYCG